jgi:hypothetical protein
MARRARIFDRPRGPAWTRGRVRAVPAMRENVVPYLSNYGKPWSRLSGSTALRSARLDALHAFGQRPERAVERDILVDAVDGAGGAAADAALRIALAA